MNFPAILFLFQPIADSEYVYPIGRSVHNSRQTQIGAEVSAQSEEQVLAL